MVINSFITNIDITFNGLQPAKKIFINGENTYLDKIIIDKFCEVEFVEVYKHFNEIISLYILRIK